MKKCRTASAAVIPCLPVAQVSSGEPKRDAASQVSARELELSAHARNLSAHAPGLSAHALELSARAPRLSARALELSAHARNLSARALRLSAHELRLSAHERKLLEQTPARSLMYVQPFKIELPMGKENRNVCTPRRSSGEF